VTVKFKRVTQPRLRDEAEIRLQLPALFQLARLLIIAHHSSLRLCLYLIFNFL
jgi:hypothetical protein